MTTARSYFAHIVIASAAHPTSTIDLDAPLSAYDRSEIARVEYMNQRCEIAFVLGATVDGEMVDEREVSEADAPASVRDALREARTHVDAIRADRAAAAARAALEPGYHVDGE